MTGSWLRTFAAAVVLTMLAGCAGAASSTSTSPGPEPAPTSEFAAFNPQGGDATITCMDHQMDQPTQPFKGGPDGNTVAVLSMLRYYVSNGNKPYCDNSPASETDRAWLDLYVSLGGNPAHVAGQNQPPAAPAPQ